MRFGCAVGKGSAQDQNSKCARRLRAVSKYFGASRRILGAIDPRRIASYPPAGDNGAGREEPTRCLCCTCLRLSCLVENGYGSPHAQGLTILWLMTRMSRRCYDEWETLKVERQAQFAHSNWASEIAPNTLAFPRGPYCFANLRIRIQFTNSPEFDFIFSFFELGPNLTPYPKVVRQMKGHTYVHFMALASICVCSCTVEGEVECPGDLRAPYDHHYSPRP